MDAVSEAINVDVGHGHDECSIHIRYQHDEIEVEIFVKRQTDSAIELIERIG